MCSLLPHSIRLDETEAIEWALDHAPENALVVIFPESVSRAVELMASRNPILEDEAVLFSEPKAESLPVLAPVTVGNNGRQSVPK